MNSNQNQNFLSNIFKGSKKFISDPVYSPLLLQCIVLSCYAIVARSIFLFERPHTLTISLIVFGVFFDFIIGYFIYKKSRFPLSTIITCFACSLLIDSPHYAIYFLAILLSILSKSIFQIEKRHIYNPANFGVVLVLVLFPEFVTGMPQIFAGNVEMSYLFLAIGFIVSWFSGVFTIALSFVLWFIFFAYIRSGFNFESFISNFSIITSPAFLLFTFHMITDPQTTPKEAKYKILWTFVLASLDAILRSYKVPYGNFYGLFVMTSILPFFKLSPTQKVRVSSPKLLKGIGFAGCLSLIYFTGYPQKFWNQKPRLNPPLAVEKKVASTIHFQKYKLGKEFVHRDPVNKFDLRHFFFSPGVSVVDINQDGYLDFFVVASHPQERNHFYINSGQGTFVESAEKFGLSKVVTPGQGAVFFDRDNDGDQDLLLTGMGCSVFYENVNNQFEIRTGVLPFGCMNAMHAITADIDQDGILDIITYGYTAVTLENSPFKSAISTSADSKKYYYFDAPEGPNSFYDGSNGQKNYVLLGRKVGYLEDATNRFFGEIVNNRFSLDVGIADLDWDGKLELVTANDFGPDTIFKITPNGFIDLSSNLAFKDRRHGMNVSFDFSPSSKLDEIPETYISNIYLDHFEQRGNFLFKKTGNRFHEVGLSYHLHDCGWAWGGNYSDLNGDGLNELYVANGYISSRESIEDDTFYLASMMTLPDFVFYQDLTSTDRANSYYSMVDHQSRSIAGFQKDCLFVRTQEDRQFYDYSNLVSDIRT